jgi:hypothetical protein
MSNRPADRAPIVDWPRAGRRLRISAVVIGAIVAGGSLVTWLAAGTPEVGTWLFGGLVAMFIVELVVVGGSAVGGMLRAGERGHRLARGDVSLLPATARRVRRIEPTTGEQES